MKVAGLVLVRQRPGTAKGICFMTIEDETGVANFVVFEKLFDQYRKEILQSRLIMVEGKLQKEGEVIHVIVRKCYDVSKLLRKLSSIDGEHSSLQTPSRADEKSPVIPSYPGANKKNWYAKMSRKNFSRKQGILNDQLSVLLRQLFAPIILN